MPAFQECCQLTCLALPYQVVSGLNASAPGLPIVSALACTTGRAVVKRLARLDNPPPHMGTVIRICPTGAAFSKCSVFEFGEHDIRIRKSLL